MAPGPGEMRALVLSRGGLDVELTPLPETGPGEVLVQVAACASARSSRTAGR